MWEKVTRDRASHTQWDCGSYHNLRAVVISLNLDSKVRNSLSGATHTKIAAPLPGPRRTLHSSPTPFKNETRHRAFDLLNVIANSH